MIYSLLKQAIYLELKNLTRNYKMINQTEIEQLKEISSLEALQDYIIKTENKLLDKELTKSNNFELEIPLKDGSIAKVLATEFIKGWCYHKSVSSHGKGYWTISHISTAQSLCTAKKTKILNAVKKFKNTFSEKDNQTLLNGVQSNLKNGKKELEYIDDSLLNKLREVRAETQ